MRFDQQGFAGLHFTRADAYFTDAIHEFADQLILEASFSKRGNAAIGFMENPAAFNGIEEMVA